MDHVFVEDGGALVRVRLNRPEKRNALTGEMLARLGEIFAGMRERRDVRAVVLSGAGQDFCAGADIAELESHDVEGRRRWTEQGQAVCDAIETCGVPVIGALWGVAAGTGCELALACHLRVATSDTEFRLSEVKLGLIPNSGATQRLARAVGPGRARSALRGKEVIMAGEPLLRNIVNRVVSREEVLSAAEQFARRLEADTAPLAVRACLEAVTRGTRVTLADGLRLEAELFSRLFSTADAREGTRAFLKKRRPVFKGE